MSPYRQSARKRAEPAPESDGGRTAFDAILLAGWVLVVVRLVRAMMTDAPNAINIALLVFLVLVTSASRA
jgi:hypothetical protein